MEIPAKLRNDLFKPYSEQTDAFEKFIAGVEIFMPRVNIKSKRRYSAFYYNYQILAYIEPLQYGIVLGFFRDDIRDYLANHRKQFTAFAQWNSSKGGLVGFDLGGCHDNLEYRLAAAAMLLMTAYQKRMYWPTIALRLS
jgi:hypothetical protein